MERPYGSWPSPISAASLVEAVVRVSEVRVGPDGAVWWAEGRPTEAGRVVVVRDGVDVLPAPLSARTRVHEYGGGAYTVGPDGNLFFSNFADQRVWTPGGPVTADDGSRFADYEVSPDGTRLHCVRERHLPEGVVNDLVWVSPSDGAVTVIAAGHDFYAAPRLSPDGTRLAWVSWDHPNMPWDGTELWVAGPDGGGATRVAGGPDESIGQPRWSPEGGLHWISDRSGWWNLYAEGVPVCPMAADFALGDWVFGQSSYTFLTDGRLVATWIEGGFTRLGLFGGDGDGRGGGELRPLDVPFTVLTSLQPLNDHEVVCLAASPRDGTAVVTIDVDTAASTTIKASRATPPPPEAISEPVPVEFPTEHSLTAHALLYRPRLEGFTGPPGRRPPLLVLSHGGPTSAAVPALSMDIQFWTSRGFAVVDVNYGGSTGYGRDYRRRLDGQWGVVDVDDVVNCARYLSAAAVGEVDGARMAIRGGSAGGYTTLCALAFRPGVFAAGASAYGVSDLAALATDTHKFEARYLDRLVGPWPEAKETYAARTPLNAADRMAAPVILFQGAEDVVVPPSQSERVVAALRRNRVPFAYLVFEGEQHGFRQASTIVRVAEAELWFYGRVLGFMPADPIEPIAVENDDRLDPLREAPVS